MNSTSWLQYVSQKLAANSYQQLPPGTYKQQQFRYAVRRSGFEISKFGNAEYFFTFADISNLDPQVIQQYSGSAFKFAMANKSFPLPCGFFEAVFCFAVAITENVRPQLAQYVADTAPVKHWSAFEMPVVFDLANGQLHHFQKTPVWGAAYYAGFRREIQSNLG